MAGEQKSCPVIELLSFVLLARRYSNFCCISGDDGSLIESLIGKMRDALLHGKIFYTVKAAQLLIEMRRKE
jgi:hypothetical protein